MKAFRFALQPVLDERVRIEDDRRAALAAAVRATAAERFRAAGLRAELRGAGDILRRAVSISTSAGVAEATARIELLGSALRKHEALLEQAAAREDAARAAFVAAHAQRRRIEALRDRAHAAYLIESLRHETLAIEETNAAAHNAATFLAPSFHI